MGVLVKDIETIVHRLLNVMIIYLYEFRQTLNEKQYYILLIHFPKLSCGGENFGLHVVHTAPLYTFTFTRFGIPLLRVYIPRRILLLHTNIATMSPVDVVSTFCSLVGMCAEVPFATLNSISLFAGKVYLRISNTRCGFG